MQHRSARVRLSPGRVAEERFGWLFAAPAILYVLLVFVIPVFFLVYLTLFNWSAFEGPGAFVGTRVLRQAVNDRVYWSSLLTSAKFVLFAVPTTLILSLLAATACSRRSPLPLKGLLRVLYFLPVVTSLAATAYIWLWLFNPAYGLFNTILGKFGLAPVPWLTDVNTVLPSLAIMFVWVRLGFDMAIFTAGLEGIPEEFYEAATIDGAKPWQAFLKITLPLLNPQIVMVSIIEVIGALKTFDLPYLATHGGPLNASRTVVLHIFDTAFRYNELNKAGAAALIFFVLILVITLVQLRLTSRKVEY